MIDDPKFYLAAIPAVLITGVSKGGFGGVALLAVPLMALVISPVQAAGIMLPILLVMDAISVAIYRRQWDPSSLLVLLPGAVAGIALGALTADWVSEHWLRLIIGLIAVLFALDFWLRRRLSPALRPTRTAGTLLGATAGYTSFLAHAGSPPFQMYMLPQRLDRKTFAGTAVWFFAVVNLVKLPPYAWLGMLSPTNLATSLVLLPAAPAGIALGVWANRRLSNNLFYQLIYGLIFVVGIQLCWTALRGFAASGAGLTDLAAPAAPRQVASTVLGGLARWC